MAEAGRQARISLRAERTIRAGTEKKSWRSVFAWRRSGVAILAGGLARLPTPLVHFVSARLAVALDGRRGAAARAPLPERA